MIENEHLNTAIVDRLFLFNMAIVNDFHSFAIFDKCEDRNIFYKDIYSKNVPIYSASLIKEETELGGEGDGPSLTGEIVAKEHLVEGVNVRQILYVRATRTYEKISSYILRLG